MKLILLFGMIFLSFLAISQSIDSLNVDSINSEEVKDTVDILVEPQTTESSIQFVSRKEFWLAISTLIVLLFTLPLLIYLINKRNLSDDASVKLILTIVVIISTLFLVTAGYDDKSIAPAFGLFGGILGYVFGRSESKNSQG